MTVSTVNVASAAQLMTVLKGATGGETILLAAGNYGSLSLSGINPASEVVIKPATVTTGVVTSSLNINNSSNLTIQGIEVAHPIQPGQENTYAGAIFYSKNITLSKLSVHGSLNNSPDDDGWGFRVRGGQNVSILDTDFREVRSAVLAEKVDGLILGRNNVSMAREGFDLSGITNSLIQRNYFTNIRAKAGTNEHADAIQFWTSNNGASSHVTIDGNVMIKGWNGVFQGIFISSQDASRYNDFRITNNVYYGKQPSALALYHTDGALIAHNTIVSAPNPNYPAQIRVVSSNDVTVQDNIANQYQFYSSVTAGNNLSVHSGGANDATNIANILNQVLDNNQSVWGMGIKAGSLADTMGAGARPTENLAALPNPVQAASDLGLYRGIMHDYIQTGLMYA